MRLRSRNQLRQTPLAYPHVRGHTEAQAAPCGLNLGVKAALLQLNAMFRFWVVEARIGLSFKMFPHPIKQSKYAHSIRVMSHRIKPRRLLVGEIIIV